MQNARVNFKIKILQGKKKGKTVEVEMFVDDLEETDLSDQLIADGHLDHCCHPYDYYEVIDRTITIEE